MKNLYKGFVAMVAMCALAGVAHAQSDYPSHPIRIVVANPPGGQTDVTTRLIAQKLGEKFGQAVIIENRPGANSNIGARYVAQSPPDGYTLVVAAINNFGSNPALVKDMPFDPVKDFKMIVQTVSSTNVLVVNANSPFHNLQDILTAARADPGKLTYGSAGLGSSMFLFMEMLKNMAKVDILHVPYQGSALADTAVMGDTISMVFDSMPGCLALVQAGSLRAIVVSSAKREPALPNVPTVAEAGVPGFEAVSWLGLAVPAKTPDAIVQKLNKAVNEVLLMPDVRAGLVKMGTRPVGGTSAQFQTFVAKQVSTWKQILADAGIHPQ